MQLTAQPYNFGLIPLNMVRVCCVRVCPGPCPWLSPYVCPYPGMACNWCWLGKHVFMAVAPLEPYQKRTTLFLCVATCRRFLANA